MAGRWTWAAVHGADECLVAELVYVGRRFGSRRTIRAWEAAEAVLVGWAPTAPARWPGPPLTRHHGLVIAWVRCYWDEEDTWFYFEVDAEGWVTRQVELQGPELTPIAAASLSEWQQAHDAGRLDEYDSRFGITAELPVSEWEGHDPEQLTFEEFEDVWGSARQQIASRPS